MRALIIGERAEADLAVASRVLAVEHSYTYAVLNEEHNIERR